MFGQEESDEEKMESRGRKNKTTRSQHKGVKESKKIDVPKINRNRFLIGFKIRNGNF